MYIVRAITEQDQEAFIKLAFQAGIGMTSMPKNREILLQKVHRAIENFRKPVEQPVNENYLFVLEELETGRIVGSSGIESRTGTSVPLAFYRIDQELMPPFLSATQQKVPLLRVVRYYNAPSEIGSLYLSPKYRHGGLGKLLSLSRFLFIASHLHRFDPILFAEMRGFIDEGQVSPFWEGIGRHFLDIRFETLMNIRDEEELDLTKALPVHPIYIPLLPAAVQQSIGQVHPHTIQALNMLIQEGFKHTDEIDLFDGGPKIEAETAEIRTVKNSKVAAISRIIDVPEDANTRTIIGNDSLNFRACYGTVRDLNGQGVEITRQTAQVLCVKEGDLVRYKVSSE